jgi:putative phage-type endonuclease
MVTASRVSDVVATLRGGGPGASRATYMGQLIAERLSGEPASSFSSAAMQWGTETEPMARGAYEWVTGGTVTEAGFIQHMTIEMAGMSPDGLIGDDGLVEIKCPNTSTHIDTLLSEKAPAKYIDQMQWQMACSGREWCDFVSYDPRMPLSMNMYITRIMRDDARINHLESSVIIFIEEMDDKIKQLTNRYKG